MRIRNCALRAVSVASTVGVTLLFAAAASAATVWTDWTAATAGSPGSASGTLGASGVSYSGELDSAAINGASPIWAPNSSFTGGSVTTSPSSVGDAIFLNGNFSGSNTITFGSPVDNPVFAIWSLGQPGLAASFLFDQTPILQAGGPNASFGGQSITISGDTVSGFEGNGVVQFAGTFSSVSWTNTFENFYAFTVGVTDAAPGPGPGVPEPGVTALLALGLLLSATVLAWRPARRAARKTDRTSR